MTTCTVRYYAGAAEAADSDTTTLELPAGSTLADLVALLGAGNRRLADVLSVCTVLLDRRAVTVDTPLPEGPAAIDVLPPFAGG